MSIPHREQYKSTRSGSPFSDHGSPSAERAAPLIALIEDELDNREALAVVLQSVGYQVSAYERADNALADMERGRRPDLVLLDLNLPGMNGWQFRVEQRKRPALADIPVVALSGDSSPFAAAIDADAYVTKPVDVSRLRTIIDQLLVASERRELATRAVELEHVRSLGMLVAAVAHEVNTPLNYVLGNLELLRQRTQALLEAPKRAKELAALLVEEVEAAHDGATRIGLIVSLLSTFARKEPARSEVDPLRALEAATRLARQQVQSRAQLVLQLAPLPLVHADEAQLAQVFLNLLINAADAIPEGHPTENEVRVRSFVADAYAVVEIEDTGCGIPDELASRVFEPFYTTKPAGKGTGLGLSISRDIVTSFGGHIALHSRLGVGTTLRVELPSAEPSNGEAPTTASSQSGPRRRTPRPPHGQPD